MIVNTVPTTSAIAIDRLSIGRCRTAHLWHFRTGPSAVWNWNATARSSEIPHPLQRPPVVTPRLCAKQLLAHVDLDPAGDLEPAILEGVDLRVSHLEGGEGGSLLLLELLDLRKKETKYQVHEADHARVAAGSPRSEAASVTLEVFGRLVGIADRPQIHGEQSLRPTAWGHRNGHDVGGAAREEAHGVKIGSQLLRPSPIGENLSHRDEEHAPTTTARPPRRVAK